MTHYWSNAILRALIFRVNKLRCVAIIGIFALIWEPQFLIYTLLKLGIRLVLSSSWIWARIVPNSVTSAFCHWTLFRGRKHFLGLAIQPTFYDEGMLFAYKYERKTVWTSCMYDWRMKQRFFALCLNSVLILHSPFWWHSKVITDCSFGKIAAFVVGDNHWTKREKWPNEIDYIAIFLFWNGVPRSFQILDILTALLLRSWTVWFIVLEHSHPWTESFQLSLLLFCCSGHWEVSQPTHARKAIPHSYESTTTSLSLNEQHEFQPLAGRRPIRVC